MIYIPMKYYDVTHYKEIKNNTWQMTLKRKLFKYNISIEILIAFDVFYSSYQFLNNLNNI